MRILIVVHGYPPTHTGGAELRAERTARGLAARGHDVAVLCIESIAAEVSGDNGHPSHEDRIQDGVWVRRISFRFQSGPDGFRQSYGNPYMGSALRRLLDERPVDLIHLFSGYLASAVVIETAVERRVPTVVSLTDFWWLCHRVTLVRANGTRCGGPSPAECARCHLEAMRRYRLPAQLARPLADGVWRLVQQSPRLRSALGVEEQEQRLAATMGALQKVDRLIAPAQHLADTYIAHGVNPAQIRVLRQGVDLTACPLRVPSETLRFGYLGQIKEHKGVHRLAEAWGLLMGGRARSLVLYGSDKGAEAYGAAVRQRTQGMENVRWAGHIGRQQVWHALANMDVLVIPSCWRENSPNVILEAQAMGVAVVGADVDGVAELVQHEGNGLRFHPDNSADLAAQLQRLLDEPALLGRLRRNLLPFCSFDDEMAQLDALYVQLLDGRDRPAVECGRVPVAGGG